LWQTFAIQQHVNTARPTPQTHAGEHKAIWRLGARFTPALSGATLHAGPGHSRDWSHIGVTALSPERYQVGSMNGRGQHTEHEVARLRRQLT
jgi:hypothetical protein